MVAELTFVRINDLAAPPESAAWQLTAMSSPWPCWDIIAQLRKPSCCFVRKDSSAKRGMLLSQANLLLYLEPFVGLLIAANGVMIGLQTDPQPAYHLSCAPWDVGFTYTPVLVDSARRLAASLRSTCLRLRLEFSLQVGTKHSRLVAKKDDSRLRAPSVLAAGPSESGLLMVLL